MHPVGPATTVSWPAALSTHRYWMAGPAARAGPVPGRVRVLLRQVGQVIKVAPVFLRQQRKRLPDYVVRHLGTP